MANPDYIFVEGWDKYGPERTPITDTSLIGGEWSSVQAVTGNWYQQPVVLRPSWLGSGYCLSLEYGNNSSSSGQNGVTKNLPSNYARSIGGRQMRVYYSGATTSKYGIEFLDGTTVQLSIGITVTGGIEVRRGNLTAGTLLATAAETVTSGVGFTLEWDVTIHNTAGIVKVWLNGVLTTINLSSQNTRSSANNYMNGFFEGYRGVGNNYPPGPIQFDHEYNWFYTASGGSETPLLSNHIIETSFASTDSAVAFTFGNHVIGNPYWNTTVGGSVTYYGNAPAANSLILRKVVADATGTLQSIGFTAGETHATVKMKGVIYAHTSGAPGALLSTGTEVVGTTINTDVVLPLVTPQSITAGTTYWIGLIMDTSFNILKSQPSGWTGDSSPVLEGYRAANTYTSGAPGTAPAMTASQSSWNLFGRVTGVTVNAKQAAATPPVPDKNYNYSATATQEDLYDFGTLLNTPTSISSVTVKGYLARSDAGARTVDLRTKSSSTSSSGNRTGLVPSSGSYSWLSSDFLLDPNTSAAWTGSGLNAAKHGVKVAS